MTGSALILRSRTVGVECLAMEPTRFVIRPRLVFRLLVAIIIILIALSLAGQISKYFLGHGRLLGFVRVFHVDYEPSVPAVFSVIMLLLSAVLFWVIASAERHRGRRSIGWYGLAALFAYLAFDEGAELHDLATRPLRALFDLGGIFHFAWVLPALVAVVLIGLIYARFIAALPAQTRRWVIIAASMYVAGALGVEMVGGAYLDAIGERNFRYELIVTVEEGLEMLAVALLLRTLLIHASLHVGALRAEFDRGPGEPGGAMCSSPAC
jgi:hypothetical protein